MKIGGDHREINPASILELDDDQKGVLLTRVEIDDLSTWTLEGGTPTEGMIVFNTSSVQSNGFYVWYNDKWNKMSTSEETSGDESLYIQVATSGYIFNGATGEFTDDTTSKTIADGEPGDHLVFSNEIGKILDVFVWGEEVDDDNDDSTDTVSKWFSVATLSTITNLAETENYYSQDGDIYNENDEIINNFYTDGDLVTLVENGDTITYYKSGDEFNEFYVVNDNDACTVIEVNSDQELVVAPTYGLSDGYYEGDMIKYVFEEKYITWSYADHDNDSTTDLDWIIVGQNSSWVDSDDFERLQIRLALSAYTFDETTGEFDSDGSGSNQSETILGLPGDHLKLINANGSTINTFIWGKEVDDDNDESTDPVTKWFSVAALSTITNLSETDNYYSQDGDIYNENDEIINNFYTDGDLVTLVENGDTVTYYKSGDEFNEFYVVNDNDASTVIDVNSEQELAVAPTYGASDGYYEGDMIKYVFEDKYITWSYADHDNDSATDLDWIIVGQNSMFPEYESMMIKTITSSYTFDPETGEFNSGVAGASSVFLTGNAGDHLVFVNSEGKPTKTYIWGQEFDDDNDDTTPEVSQWSLISPSPNMFPVSETTTYNWEIIDGIVYADGDVVSDYIFSEGDILQVVENGETVSYVFDGAQWNSLNSPADENIVRLVYKLRDDVNEAPSETSGYSIGDVIKNIVVADLSDLNTATGSYSVWILHSTGWKLISEYTSSSDSQQYKVYYASIKGSTVSSFTPFASTGSSKANFCEGITTINVGNLIADSTIDGIVLQYPVEWRKFYFSIEIDGQKFDFIQSTTSSKLTRYEEVGGESNVATVYRQVIIPSGTNSIHFY